MTQLPAEREAPHPKAHASVAKPETSAHAGIDQLRALLGRGGTPPPDEVAKLVKAHPKDADAMFRVVHEVRGNGYAQQVVAAMHAPADQTGADAQVVGAELASAIGLFRAQVGQEETFHQHVKASRDKQGMVGAAEEDLEAGEERLVSLWHSLRKQPQTAYRDAHVELPDPKIWKKVYGELDQAAGAAARYVHSHDAADMDQVRAHIKQAQDDYKECHDLVGQYVGRLKSGAQALAVVGTCVVIVATVASGGIAAAAGAGLLGIASTTAVVTFGAEVGVGALENATGVTKVREADDSFLTLVKQSGADAAVTFTGVLLGGALSKAFMAGLSGAIAKLLGQDAPMVMQKLGIASTGELADHLTSPLQKYLVYAAAGAASSPVTAAVQVVLSGASSKMRTKDFVALVIDTAIQQGIVQLFVGAVTHGYAKVEVGEAKAPASHPKAQVHNSVKLSKVSVEAGKITARQDAKLKILLRHGQITAEDAAKFADGSLSVDEHAAIQKQLGDVQLTGEETAKLKDGKFTLQQKAHLVKLLKSGQVTAEEVVNYQTGKLSVTQKANFEKRIDNVHLTAADLIDYEQGVVDADAFVKLVEWEGETRITEAVDASVTAGKDGASAQVDLKFGITDGKKGIGAKVELSPGVIETSLGVRMGKVHLQGVFRGLRLREIDASVDGQRILNAVLKLVGNYGVNATSATVKIAGLVKLVRSELGPIQDELKRLGKNLESDAGVDDGDSFAGAVAVLTAKDKESLVQQGLLTAAGAFDRSLGLPAVAEKLAASSLDEEQRAAIIAEFGAN